MVMITPAGEMAHHRDIKAANVVIGDDNQLHLLDPGVEFERGEMEGVGGFDFSDREGEEPWEEDERITLTTFASYPTFPPGTPGADLAAIGLMVYEGLTGRSPFGAESPAPRSYNYALGAHGRGVPSPQIIMGRIPAIRQVDPSATVEMERVVRKLLHAPFGHELSLGHGRSLRQWAALCHEAAESVR
jgi:serine/threonine protein kinase